MHVALKPAYMLECTHLVLFILSLVQYKGITNLWALCHYCGFSCWDLWLHILFAQFHYAVFFAYIRLREQEIRNLMWISECVAQNQKNRVHDSVVFIFWPAPATPRMVVQNARFDDGTIGCDNYKHMTYYAPLISLSALFESKTMSECIIVLLFVVK